MENFGSEKKQSFYFGRKFKIFLVVDSQAEATRSLVIRA
jgi:hypothetical protein